MAVVVAIVVVAIVVVVVVTPAAVVVVIPAPAAVAAVVIPAGKSVVAVESVRVATPERVPELTGTPLREGPRLGLGHGSRSDTDEPQS